MLTVIHIRSCHLMSATHQLCCTKLNSNENDQSNILLIRFEYIYIYIRDEWATMKQACRDELVVYLFFSPIYIYIYLYIL